MRVSYYWKSLTFDVRYWDTDLSDDECVPRSGFSDGCDARVVETISLHNTWSAFVLLASIGQGYPGVLGSIEYEVTRMSTPGLAQWDSTWRIAVEPTRASIYSARIGPSRCLSG